MLHNVSWPPSLLHPLHFRLIILNFHICVWFTPAAFSCYMLQLLSPCWRSKPPSVHSTRYTCWFSPAVLVFYSPHWWLSTLSTFYSYTCFPIHFFLEFCFSSKLNLNKSFHLTQDSSFSVHSVCSEEMKKASSFTTAVDATPLTAKMAPASSIIILPLCQKQNSNCAEAVKLLLRQMPRSFRSTALICYFSSLFFKLTSLWLDLWPFDWLQFCFPCCRNLSQTEQPPVVTWILLGLWIGYVPFEKSSLLPWILSMFVLQ